MTAEDAARASLNEIQHLTGCGPAWKASTQAEQDALIDVLLKHQVVMTPTLVVWDRLGRVLDLSFQFDSRRQWVHPCHPNIWDYYQSRFGPPRGRLQYQEPMAHLKRCLARMQEKGVAIAMGTDTPFPHLVPGFSMHDELAMYVDAGIKPVAALRSATSVGAKVLGFDSQVGRIGPGMEADLVVVNGNPLERIDILVVYRDGVPRALLHGERDGKQHNIHLLATFPGAVSEGVWLLKEVEKECRREGVERLSGPFHRPGLFYGGYVCGREPYHPHWATDATDAYVQS